MTAISLIENCKPKKTAAAAEEASGGDETEENGETTEDKFAKMLEEIHKYLKDKRIAERLGEGQIFRLPSASIFFVIEKITPEIGKIQMKTGALLASGEPPAADAINKSATKTMTFENFKVLIKKSGFEHCGDHKKPQENPPNTGGNPGRKGK